MRASTLIGSAADLAAPIQGAVTPSLGRARIDERVLSAREYEICVRAAQGTGSTAIAEELYLSPRTVQGHLQRSYTKLGVSDRRQLILR